MEFTRVWGRRNHLLCYFQFEVNKMAEYENNEEVVDKKRSREDATASDDAKAAGGNPGDIAITCKVCRDCSTLFWCPGLPGHVSHSNMCRCHEKPLYKPSSAACPLQNFYPDVQDCSETFYFTVDDQVR